MSADLAEIIKLKNIQIYLEKNNKHLLDYIAKYDSEFDLYNYVTNSESNRVNENRNLNTELKEIWQLTQTTKINLKENLNKLELNSFKKDMILLQEKMHALKLKLSINQEKLKDEEQKLWELNEIFNQKLSEWEKPIKINKIYTLPKNRIVCSSNYNKEVAEFLDFVTKSNGFENGWSSEDHQLFLKLRRKYRSIDELAINLNKLLPDLSLDDIKEHESWYKKFMFLKKRKQEALEKWRKEKLENSCQVVEETGNEVKHKYTFKTSDENVQEKIATWKAEKEAKRQQEIAKEEMKRKRERIAEENKRKLNCQVKQIVQKWREAKVQKEEREKVEKEIEEYQQRKLKAAIANKMIPRFQSQDDLYISKMRSIKMKENKTKKRSKSSCLVSRDPERILKPTKQWILRTKKYDFVNEQPVHFHNLKEIPKLKIPEWRKNAN